MNKLKNRRSESLLLILLTIIGVAEAQTYEFAPIGAEWFNKKQELFTQGYVKIQVTNDTIIDDYKCSVLNIEEFGFDFFFQQPYHFEVGKEYIMQYKDSVMIYRKGHFYKLFDFGAEIGTSWIVPGDSSCEEEEGRVSIVGKGSEIINGVELRYILLIDDLNSSWGFGNGMVGEPADTIKVLECIGPIESSIFPRQKCLFDNDKYGTIRCYSDDFIYVNYSWPSVNCDFICDGYVDLSENYDNVTWNIFPNPTKDDVTVIISTNTPFIIELYDNTGRKIRSFNEKTSFITIPLNNVPSGLYYLTCNVGTTILSTKILKE
ncbi:MAG: T9SS type A sorting domain-containing protein [Bacteroidales bacterium]|nr:T9SS type A sorting domain-containing protein [Bacteroidales bacterium]